jgi:predicted DNA-binding transcriptional regulator AlpA
MARAPEAGLGGDFDTVAIVLGEDKAARLVGLSARTLQKLRLEGDGPRFVRLTGRRIGYTADALRAWVDARSVGSTSETAARR